MGMKQQTLTTSTSPPPAPKSSSPERRQQKPQKKLSKSIIKAPLILTIMVVGITISVFLQRWICRNWQFVAEKVYGFSSLSYDTQKLEVLKQTMLYMAVLQFLIVFSIMTIRIVGQKVSPVAEKDPLSISLLNRILSNNLQQSLIFFGLYTYLLLSNPPQRTFPITYEALQTRYIFALPLIFIIGRVLFDLAYIVATVVGISTIRSFGFAFSVVVNLIMVQELVLDKTTYMRGFFFGQ